MIQFVFFNSESDADNFYLFLNQQHPNIKSIIEKQTHNQISFSDSLVNNNGDSFLKPVYCKKHSTGLYTDYLSLTLFSYKIGLVKTVLHRAFAISSIRQFFT